MPNTHAEDTSAPCGVGTLILQRLALGLLFASDGAAAADPVVTWARLALWEGLRTDEKAGVALVLLLVVFAAVYAFLWRREIPEAVASLPDLVAGLPDAVSGAVPAPVDYTHEARELIDRYADWVVVGLRVRRAPVMAALSAAIDAVSGGTFNRALREYSHDRIFHLGLLVELEEPPGAGGGGGGREAELLVEKLEVISVSWPAAATACTECKRVKLGGGPAVAAGEGAQPEQLPLPTTLRALLDRAQAAVEAAGRSFFVYDAFLGSNCQDFVLALLHGSAAELRITNLDAVCAFVKQDIEGVVRALPPHVVRVARALTDVGAALTGTVDEGRFRVKQGVERVDRAVRDGLRKRLEKGGPAPTPTPGV